VKEDSTNVSRELARLEKAGILVSATEGKQKYYQANRHNPIFNELHGLILKTSGVADIIRKCLVPRIPDIQLSFVFGSVAGKTENRLSDIDLLIVGDITFGEIVDLLSPAEKVLSRELNPVVYSVAEFDRRLSENHYFISNILSGDKIFIVGDENELQSLVGKGLDKGT
jgi:predicted nucleotidyltransferase